MSEESNVGTNEGTQDGGSNSQEGVGGTEGGQAIEKDTSGTDTSLDVTGKENLSAAELKTVKPTADPEVFELTVDGKKLKMSREDVIRQAQLGHGSSKRFKEGKEALQLAEQVLEGLVKDPEAVLAKLGVDVDAFVQKRVEAKARTEMMTPEQRKVADLEERVRVADEREKSTQAQAEEHRQALVRETVADQMERDLLAAVTKAGLPKDPQILDEMCTIGLEAIELGVELTADQLVAEVQARRGSQATSFVDHITKAGLKGKALLDVLGPNVVKMILQASLDGHKADQKKELKKLDPPPPRGTEHGMITSATFDQRMKDLAGK